MSLSDIETQKSYKYLYEVETLAQNILTLKEERLELENGRNKVREAFRALEAIDKRRTWMQVGQVYVERPTAECKGLLKDELQTIERDLKDLGDDIRGKLGQLRDLEHEPRLEGFGLKPISSAEAKALHKGFGL